jgi:transcriptional regulator GlxA family with amidase domain
MGQDKGSASEPKAGSTTGIGASNRPIMNEAAFGYYPRLSKVREFVESHLSEPISLSDAARIADYERTYFCDWFHRRAGLRFREWLTLERLRRATELIRTEDYPIWEVARTVGFRSLRTFERAFKRGTLISPRAFKTHVRNLLSPDGTLPPRRKNPVQGPLPLGAKVLSPSSKLVV